MKKSVIKITESEKILAQRGYKKPDYIVTRIKLLQNLQLKPKSSIKELAVLCGKTQRTIKSWQKKYLEEGIDGLLREKRTNNKKSLYKEYHSEIRKILKAAQKNPVTRKEIFLQFSGKGFLYNSFCAYIRRHRDLELLSRSGCK